MQHNSKEYDEKNHTMFKSLTIKQPFADKIMTGEKKVEVRKWNTTYRGDLIITSSKKPYVEGRSGVAICKVELYDVVKIGDLTEQEVSDTCLTPEQLEEYGGYAWLLRNPKELKPVPLKGNLGIFKLVVDKGYIQRKFNHDDIPEDTFSAAKFITYMILVLSIIGFSALILYLAG